MGSENQELLQIVTAMAENVGDVAESAETTKRASVGLSASAARLEASAAEIEFVADRAADAAAAKVAESAEASLASFRAEYGRIAHDALAPAIRDARKEVDAMRAQTKALRKASTLIAVASTVFAIAGVGVLYAAGRVALNQIASANAAIKSTNALVEQVNDALGTALPPVDPIPGAAMAGAVNDFFSALCALGALAGIIALWWFLTVVRRH